MKLFLKASWIIVLVSVVGSAQAQKIKYKDLFFLIHKSKKYEDGEPFLRSFLKNPKNDDHANAHFQMAVIHEHNAKKLDVLKENDDKVSLLDSAVYFYSKAKSLMTDKEVKKHSDYYEDDYMRRDLRTGKMGIKSADVMLDIDKRIEGIQESMSNLRAINDNFQNAKNQYDKAFKHFTDLAAEFESNRIFLLRTNPDVLKKIDAISLTYDSAMGHFADYKLAIAKISNPDYDQSLSVLSIDDIKDDIKNDADFFSEQVEVYDFSTWGSEVKRKVEEEINPAKSQMEKYDARLDKLREKLFTDSTSVISEINIEKDDDLANVILKNDSEAMPVALLSAKEEELRYWSLVFEHNRSIDTAMIVSQVKMAEDEVRAVTAMDSAMNILLGYDLAKEVENYQGYINKQYEGTSGLERFIRQKLSMAQEEKKYREKILEARVERSKWLLYGNDSIPLALQDSVHFAEMEGSKYLSYGILRLDSVDRFVYGVRYDTLGNVHSYAAIVPDSLITDQIITVKLDNKIFTKETHANLKVQTIQSGELYYILFYDGSTYESKAQKGYLTCVDGTGRLHWSIDVSLAYPPDNITTYDPSGVAVNYNVKYIDTENANNLKSRLLINKDGKIVN